MADHLTDADLHRYHARELNEGEIALVESHLASCDACGRRGAELQAGHDALLDRLKKADVGERRTAATPERIGDYRIIRKVGEGGMGIVFEAEQADPKRRVALKIVRGGPFVSDEAVRLFRREVQTLARLQHPGIAHLYEAGRTESGQPFFAMEFVEGETLTDYAQRARLSVAERLRLFVRICEAVHYAHQRGVIHRDLKPSNILIVDQGPRSERAAGTHASSAGAPAARRQPKILDFGLAKITDSDTSLTLSATEVGRVMGTLSYMSPEQARGRVDELDIRSDIYSLGVLLYELLTGQLPYRVTQAALLEAVRVISEEPPVAPSTMNRLLRGDLEVIALKALEKEPPRRYASAAGFAEDIERYLSNLPISARRPSAVYQMQKFVRRHAAVTGFAAVLLVLIVVFGITSAVLMIREARARQAAEIAKAEALENAETARIEALKAKNVSDFLQDMFTSVDPDEAKGHEVTVREVLDAAVREIGTSLTGQPQVEAAIRETLGQTYRSLGDVNAAEQQLRSSLDRYRALPGDHTARIHRTQLDLAESLQVLGRLDESEALANEALAALRRTDPGDHESIAGALNQLGVVHRLRADFDSSMACHEAALVEARALGPTGRTLVAATLLNIASVHREKNDFPKSAESFRAALDVYRDQYGEEHTLVARAMSDLALTLMDTGEFDEARSLLARCLQIRRKLLDDDHPDVSITLNNLAHLSAQVGDFAQAEKLNRESLAMWRSRFGDEHAGTAMRLNNLATSLQQLGRYDEAESAFREALDIRRRVYGPAHPDVAASLNNLANLLHNRGDLATAEPLYREALEIYRTTFGDEHMSVATLMQNLATVLQQKGDLAGAEAMAREVLAVRRKLLSDTHPDVGLALNNLGSLLKARADYASAEDVFREALRVYEAAYGQAHPLIATAQAQLAGVLRAVGRLEEAEALCRSSLEMRRALLGDDHPDVATGLNGLASILFEKKDYEAAEPVFREVLERDRKAYGEKHPYVAGSLGNLARVVQENGKLDEAEQLHQEAIALTREIHGDDHAELALRKHNYAGLLRERGDLDQAEAMYLEALAVFRKAFPDGHPRTAATLSALGVLNLTQNDAASAEPLFRETVEIYERFLPTQKAMIARAQRSHGDCLLRLQRYDEAETALRSAYDTFTVALGKESESTFKTVELLISLYDAWGKPAEADVYRQRLPQTQAANDADE